jgi:hypothetical protein
MTPIACTCCLLVCRSPHGGDDEDVPSVASSVDTEGSFTHGQESCDGIGRSLRHEYVIPLIATPRQSDLHCRSWKTQPYPSRAT